MKIIDTLVTFALLLFFVSSLNAADKTIELKQGWNQIAVPYDHVKLDLLIASSEIEVIWAYQNRQYNLLTKSLEYKLMAKNDNNVGTIYSLAYGESLYILAKNDTTITFVGQTNYNPPVRADQITAEWKQMTKADFKKTQWSSISKIVEGHPVIASKMIMKDGRASLRVFSNIQSEVTKIDSEFYEDFVVGDNESFWIKDISNISDVNTFNVTMAQTPQKGGELINFDIDAKSTSKNRKYLAVKIVAIQDNDISHEHVLFDDYISLNRGTQKIRAVMPMIEAGDSGNYKIYIIKDISAQYSQLGIDIFNITDENPQDVQNAYKSILDNADYKVIDISSNSTTATYSLKLESREYANSVLFYDPVKELNRLAKNRSRDVSEFTYNNIGRHTEFQMSLDAFGHNAQKIDKTKIRAYIDVAGTDKQISVLGTGGEIVDSYELDDLEISTPQNAHTKSLTLSLMMYEPTATTSNSTVYDAVTNVLEAHIEDDPSTLDHDESNEYKNQICLDSSCTTWMFKKDFTIKFTAQDGANSEQELGTTTVSLYSEVYSKKLIENYESKDTVLSLINNLLKEDTFYNDGTAPIGKLGTAKDSDILINDLKDLKQGLKDNTDTKYIFDPLVTYVNDKINHMIYKRTATGAIDFNSALDSNLKSKWDTYVTAAGGIENLCNRENYFGKTTPYIKSIPNPIDSNQDDIDVLTATDDLCLYNVKYSKVVTMSKIDVETLAASFRNFVTGKKSIPESARLGSFWNPLLQFGNSTLHMPEFLGITLPVIKKRMGGGVTFSAKMALDTELNELRTAIYGDVDVALIKEFKLMDLDFETVLSGSNPSASRFDFYMYAVNPLDESGGFALKKIIAFHQPIPTTYATSETADATLEYGKKIEFNAGISIRFAFEVGVYNYFMTGIDLDMSKQFMIYAVPGSRVYGTITGGLSISAGIKIATITLDLDLLAEDFTVVRAAVPVVAKLDSFKLNATGFSTKFKLYSNIELKVAEILLKLDIAIKLKLGIGFASKTFNLLNKSISLWNYKGIDPLKAVGHVGQGTGNDVTDCQSHYYGYELMCITKEIKIDFPFSGLTDAQCSLLDDEYARRKTIDNDTSYLYSTNDFRNVRGCINNEYAFKNVALSDWDKTLSFEQRQELDNISFWKKDSRAMIVRKLDHDGVSIIPTVSQIINAIVDENYEIADPLQEEWKRQTGH